MSLLRKGANQQAFQENLFVSNIMTSTSTITTPIIKMNPDSTIPATNHIDINEIITSFEGGASGAMAEGAMVSGVTSGKFSTPKFGNLSFLFSLHNYFLFLVSYLLCCLSKFQTFIFQIFKLPLLPYCL